MLKVQFGKITGYDGIQFKDVRLKGKWAEEWDWNRTGTKHIPGIQIADLTDLITPKVKMVILGTGYDNRLRVPDNVIKYLHSFNITVHILNTNQAVQLYNQQVENYGDELVGLIHSTC